MENSPIYFPRPAQLTLSSWQQMALFPDKPQTCISEDSIMGNASALPILGRSHDDSCVKC